MDSYDWDYYSGSRLKKVVDHLIKDSLENLISLSRDQCLMTEIAIFRKNLEKISIRLRNSKISSLLKKVRRLINQYLVLNITEVLEKECKVFLSVKHDGNKKLELPSGYSVIIVMKELRHLADILDKICKYSSYSVSHCMLWLRLGHMIPHFVVALSTISRLNIICRALLIYVSDLYGGLIEFCKNCMDSHLLDPQELEITDGPLKDLQVKCVDELDDEDILMVEEDIGQVVNRNELNPITTDLMNSSELTATSSDVDQLIFPRKKIFKSPLAKYTSYGVLKRVKTIKNKKLFKDLKNCMKSTSRARSRSD